MIKKIILSICILFTVSATNAQIAYEHVSAEEIYDFLEELENIHVIQINTHAKPYAKTFIAEKLKEAKGQTASLTPRQQEELEMYWQAYRIHLEGEKIHRKDRFDLLKGDNISTGINPVALTYKDDFVTFVGEPIIGMQFFGNENTAYHHYNSGAEGTLYMGKHVGMYVKYVDNQVSTDLVDPNYLQQLRSAPDVNRGDNYFTEITGGITADFGFGSIGLVKEHVEWGPNQNGSNIFSSSVAPALPMIKLDLSPVSWFEFHYFHGWLASNVIDSVQSFYEEGGTLREYYVTKFMAGNYITFKPWGHTNISLGNTVIYGGQGVQAGFLNPILFYRPVDYQAYDYNNGAGTNGQLYVSLSTRALKGYYFYGSVFVDELSLADYFDEGQRRDEMSFKIGAEATNLLPNLSLGVEYTHNRPGVYRHDWKSINYTSNDFTMGHYLRDNSQEIFAKVQYRPIRGLLFDLRYEFAQRGPDDAWKSGGGSDGRDGTPFMETVDWQKQYVGLKAQYQVGHKARVYLKYAYQNITGNQSYTPEAYRGKTNTVSGGISMGL